MKKKFIPAAGLLMLCLSAIAQPKIKLDTFATNVNKPVVVTNDRNTSKMYVVSQDGRIFVFDSNGTRLDTFLNIIDRVLVSSEQGLLGLTFHPNYASNGYFYVNYTKKNDGATRISRFKVSANPNRAIADSEVVILTYAQPFANHNGGDVQFGPDGYLYISSGDGGLGGDPNNNGQNKNSFLGKILRIDVNSGSPYAVPPSNPFVGQSNVKEEIWSYGLRNPWRFSFDRQTHDLFIGDVGQDAVEEIDFLATGASGANFGWSCYEGNSVYAAANCTQPITHTVPIFTVAHPTAESITGGYVYRGTDVPTWQGVYFFGDYVTGRMWVMQNTGTWTSAELPQTTFGVSSFGEDESGELYVLDYQFEGSNSALYRLGDPAQLTLRLYLANVSK
jgi:glucose/arabinose dehydrogenase